MSGKDITFDVNGQPSAGYLAVPAQTNAPGVLVLHAWWGLNSIFKSLCDRLAGEGFIAFAPDLYHGKVADNIADAESFGKALDTNHLQAKAEIAQATRFLNERVGQAERGLAVIGFSMGAYYALDLAAADPEHIRSVVLFYGSGGVDYSKSRAAYLGHFAGNDEFEPLEGIRAMEAEMRTSELRVTFHIYPNTKHWFFEENRPEYDPQAAGLAWSRTLEFLRE